MTPANYKSLVEFSRSKKRNKYRAKRTKVDGLSFASKAESRRYAQLKVLESSGQIQNLRLQVRFPLAVNGKLVCTYVADFVYHERGQEIVEDSKGMSTPEFKLKAKLYAAIFGSEILITGKAEKDNGWLPRKVQNRSAA